MAFGIGINTAKPAQGGLRGRQHAIACECWFNSRGEIVPRLFKYVEDGEVFTVRDIRVLYSEQKNYAGVSSVEYCCEILEQGNLREVKLVFFKEECKWVLLENTK